jgi:hypothetical protein
MTGQKPEYRILWTWDYCTFWDDTRYVRGTFATGVNQRRTHFLKDYKRMVDYGAKIGVNGIVIWGALRAHDNGIEQFRELVSYGKQKGVRILPGVGVFSYGGIVYDPRENFIMPDESPKPSQYSQYSLSAWLNERPELAAVGSDGRPVNLSMFSAVACPSKKENTEWFKRAFEWLCAEFALEGMQIEIGDYAVCCCDDCKKRREGTPGSVFMVEDMTEPYNIAYDIAKKANPDSWVICETYSSFAYPKPGDRPSGFGSALDEAQKKLLGALPSDAVLQWVLDRAVGYMPTQEWTETVLLPPQAKNNISRIHAGSQWQVNSVEGWAAYAIGDMVKKARACGINGVSIFGEESPASPPNEANYLMFSEFSGFGNENPDCDFELFHRRTLDPLYGGPGMSDEWKRIYITAHMLRLNKRELGWGLADPLGFHHAHHEINQPELHIKSMNMSAPDKQKETLRLAEEARAVSSKLSGDACRRWAWLENWLWRAEFLHRTNVII